MMLYVATYVGRDILPGIFLIISRNGVVSFPDESLKV